MSSAGLTHTDRLALLSDAQRDCLKLVAENRSSKEIARLLAISPHTVDQRLKRAVHLLDVGSRFEAARLLAVSDGPSSYSGLVYDTLVYQRPDVYSTGHIVDVALPANEPNPLAGGATDTTLQETQARYFGEFAPREASRSFPSVLLDTARENDLSPQWRLLIIITIMLMGIVGFAALVSVAEGLSRIS